MLVVFDRGLSHPNVQRAKHPMNTTTKVIGIVVMVGALAFVALYGITYIIITGKWEPMNG